MDFFHHIHPFTPQHSKELKHLQLAGSSDGDCADGAAVVAGAVGLGLNLVDDGLGVIVGNLAEDDVLAVKVRGLDEGDEELGAVAAWTSVLRHPMQL